jgi:hypothetical protein
MIQVAFSSSFQRAFKKRIAGNKALEEKFWQRVAIFVEIRTIRGSERTSSQGN